MEAMIRLIVTGAVVVALLGACAPATPTAASVKPASPLGIQSPVVTPVAVPTVVVVAPTKPAPTATPAPAVSKIKRGGILRTASMFTPATLDTHLKTAGDATFELLFDRFVRVSMDERTRRFEMGPMLAESWEYTNPTTIVLKLRKDVKFHDGTSFNAEVAKWNIDRMLTHPKSTARGWLPAIGSVDVVDPSTIKLNLKQPSGTVLILMTSAGSEQGTGVVSKAAVEQLGDDKFGANPVGSGPMKFTRWVRDSEITLSRVDNYWDMGVDGKPLPYLDGITARFIPDQAVSLIELRAGNVDAVEVDAKDVPQAKTNPDLIYWQMDWVAFQRGIGFNTKEGRFTDAKLREAVCRSIDRESMAKVLSPEVGIPAYYFWSPAQVGYSDSIPKLGYDPDKAKQLLREAGYPNGLEVTLSMTARAIDQRAAEMLQAMWAKVGINLTIDAAEREAWLAKVMKAGNFEMTMFRQTLMVDPDKYTGNFATGGTTNWTNLSDPEIDKGMSEARSSADPKVRQEAYERVQRLIQDKAYRCSTYLTPYNITYRKYVKGVKAEWNIWDLREAWLDK